MTGLGPTKKHEKQYATSAAARAENPIMVNRNQIKGTRATISNKSSKSESEPIVTFNEDESAALTTNSHTDQLLVDLLLDICDRIWKNPL